MPVEIDIQVNARAPRLFMEAIDRKALPIAEVRSLNKTIVSVRQRGVQLVHARRRLKKSEIRKELRITRAGRGRFEARISASNRPIPLKRYTAKWSGRGKNRRVVVNITGRRKKLEHAFIIDEITGRQVGHVFERVGPGRLPIRKLHGPSLGSALRNPAVSGPLLGFAGDRWGTVFPRELDFEISRQRRRIR